MFKEYEKFEFENPLQFNSVESLFKYWSSYNLYDSRIEHSFKAESKKYFENNSTFETKKRVIGIKAIK